MDQLSEVTVTFTALNETDRTTRLIVFAFTFTSFFITVFLNSMLILIIVIEKTLHEPMYIFLCNLCVNGLCGTAGLYPKLLSDLITETRSASFQGCMVQSYVIFTYGVGEFTNLSVMALDRYLAICRPLHYHNIMGRATIFKLLAFIWMFPCCAFLVIFFMIIRTSICGRYIDKLFCGNIYKDTAACKVTTSDALIKGIFVSVVIIIVAFVFFSYVKLIIACKQSKLNQKKFMATCVPHLMAFINFMILSVLEATHTQFKVQLPQTFQQINSALLLVIPPFVNPIIYGIKLTPIKTQTLYFVKKLQVHAA